MNEKNVNPTNEMSKRDLRKAQTAEVMELTGWDKHKAHKAYRKAYKDHGIGYADYISYKFYEIPEEEHGKKWKKIQKAKEKEAREREFVSIWESNGRKLTKKAVCTVLDIPFDGEDETYTDLRYTKKVVPGCLFAMNINKSEKDPSKLDDKSLKQAKNAIKNGAKRILCSEQIEDYPCLIVPEKSAYDDTLAILKPIRKQYDFTAVEITGSYGKTTTSTLIQEMLNTKYKLFGHDGRNTNTLPQAVYRLFKVEKDCEYYVQEASEAPAFGVPGSISRIVLPKIALITNIGNSHIETMGSQEKIMESCLSLQKGMPDDGVLVLNGDDKMLRTVESDHKIVYYGYENEDVDYFATNIRETEEGIMFDVVNDGEVTPVTLHCLGVHNVQNAVGAFAVGRLAGMTAEEAAAGLGEYRPQGIRQNLVSSKGYNFYLDCYNASEESMKSSMDTVASIAVAPGGHRIAVLADIMELGDKAEELHRSVGRYVCNSNIETLICYGENSKFIAQEAEKNPAIKVLHMESHQEIIDYLKENATDKDLILLKGSNAMELQNVFEGLCGEKHPEKPYGTKISSITKAGIEFYWKKLEIASGYEIFRSYEEEGPFEKIAEIEKRSIGTYIDSEFDHSKRKVYYTLRSFLVNDDGERTYSEMLPPKEAAYRDEMTIEREATYLYSGTSRNIRSFAGWGEPENVEWTSSNEEVATIDQDGNITAVATGESTIICTDSDTGNSCTGKVVVNRAACEPLTPPQSRFEYCEETGFWKNNSSEKQNDAVILMVGDMMCGKKQMSTQYTESEGWNFNDSFTFVRDFTSEADFSVGNLETLLAAGWPYMTEETYINNMNNCNATSRYLDAVKYGGFDAVVMANNHNCDGGIRALNETIEQVDKYKFIRTGVFCDADEDRFFIADVNGIKVGFLSYISKHTGFNGKDQSWSQEEKDRFLHIFSEKTAKNDISACKAAGAEYVIVYMHWGYKNYRKPVDKQLEEARIVADAGADYIVGSNPHTVQPYDLITAEDGREVPCFYSVGNFQSVMKQIIENRDSVVVRIRLKKDENGRVWLEENGYIPCYTFNQCKESRWAPVSVGKRYHTGLKKKTTPVSYERTVKTIGDKIDAI